MKVWEFATNFRRIFTRGECGTRIRYQNVIAEFTATQEADLLVENDRVLVADNTTGYTRRRNIVINVLQLTLSQNVDMTKHAEYTDISSTLLTRLKALG